MWSRYDTALTEQLHPDRLEIWHEVHHWGLHIFFMIWLDLPSLTTSHRSVRSLMARGPSLEPPIFCLVWMVVLTSEPHNFTQISQELYGTRSITGTRHLLPGLDGCADLRTSQLHADQSGALWHEVHHWNPPSSAWSGWLC